MVNDSPMNDFFSRLKVQKKPEKGDKEKSVDKKDKKESEESKGSQLNFMNLFSGLAHKKETHKKETVEKKEEEPKEEEGKVKIKYKAEDILKVDQTSSLIKVKRQEKLVPLVNSRIRYSAKEESLVYFLIEPKLNKKLKEVVDKTITFFEERVDIPLDKLKASNQIYSYLGEKMKDAWKVYNFSLTMDEILVVKYYVFRETLGLGKIEALMHDPNIEDVSCDGVKLPVYIYHRNPRFGEMPTNIIFNDKEELDNYVLKLAQKCGRSLSVANPLMDGSLPDGSRVQVTYGTEIARRGSNFTIRKFTKKPLSPIDLVNFGTINEDLLAYLWFLIEKQKSLLVTGSTAVGKTSFLNVLSLFIDPNAKVVSIEDTSELRLPHPNWIPEVSRIGFGPHHYGEVTMYDLLKSSLRQRPDYLVVGEVRGQEASVMFHAMSTGHPAFSTIHADRMETVIDRLTTRPISLPPSILETLNAVVFLVKSKHHGKLIRRLGQIQEIEGYDTKEKELKYNLYANWEPTDDSFTIKDSIILKRLPKEIGISEEKIFDDIARKKKILQWMKEKNISDYRDIAKIIQLYYSKPEEVYKLIERGK
ncbi:MAG: type II/IV secretion system ATPase subunit [Candidatus Woesearchaeota archaeon]|nr:MAG: type II/IV secretion system ATPase subunit [Candidatus Woesearchaeota archaeon]